MVQPPEHGYLPGYAAGQQHVVGRQIYDECAFRTPEALIKGCAHAPVGGQWNKRGFRKCRQKIHDPGDAVVGTAVVHDNQLDVGVRLARDRKKSFPHEPALVVADANHCHHRQGPGSVRGKVGRRLQNNGGGSVLI
jgi:hypothetical protein